MVADYVRGCPHGYVKNCCPHRCGNYEAILIPAPLVATPPPPTRRPR